MNILVTGGAGYIGSVMTRQLLDNGHTVTVFDNLLNGYPDAVDKRATFVQGDLLDTKLLSQTLSSNKIEAVIHFAAVLSVAESMKNPGKYFTNNVAGTNSLLEAMVETNVSSIIFSSTAGVYGTPKRIPISEDHEKNPESVYGESKLMIEKMLSWYDKIHGVKSVCLRYFNAAGASLDGVLGERHKDETHIIPLALQSVLSGSTFNLYGTDYDTSDGTCLRDYIHVEDLGRAHRLVLEHLMTNKTSNAYNLGTGHGYSNKEVVDMVEKVTGKKVTVENKPRRPGDPSQLVADASKITKELQFVPEHSDLETIVRSAWDFHRAHGFSS